MAHCAAGWNRKAILGLGLLLQASFSLCVPAAHAADALGVRRITAKNTVYPFGGLAISGDRIVWTDVRYSGCASNYDCDLLPDPNLEIFQYNLATKIESRVTARAGRDTVQDLDGDWLIYLQHPRYGESTPQPFKLIARNLKVGGEIVIRSTPNFVGEFSSAADFARAADGKVVWIEGITGSTTTPTTQVYVYDLASKTTTQITNSTSFKTQPDISGFGVVWLSTVPGLNMPATLNVYDLQSKQTGALPGVYTNGGRYVGRTGPRVFADKIVATNSDMDTILFERTSTGFQSRKISEGLESQWGAVVGKNMALWEKVVRSVYGYPADNHIMGYDIQRSKLVTITDAAQYKSKLDTDGNRNVWIDGRNDKLVPNQVFVTGWRDIYLYDPADAPDLTVKSLVPSASLVVPGHSITVTDTTANIGKRTAPASVTVYHLLAISRSGTAEEPVMKAVTRAVPALAANAQNSGKVIISIPATLPGGSYSLCARADMNDSVIEADETNNKTCTAISVARTGGIVF